MLREYRERTGDELMDFLRSQVPVSPDAEKLFDLPSKHIVRRQIFREGADFILKLIDSISREDTVPDSAENSGPADMT